MSKIDAVVSYTLENDHRSLVSEERGTYISPVFLRCCDMSRMTQALVQHVVDCYTNYVRLAIG
jgi:hypothetical protein